MSEMNHYVPRATELAATAVEHEGVPYLLVAQGGRLHCIQKEIFEVLYERHPNQRPVAVVGHNVARQAPPREAQPARVARPVKIARKALKKPAASPVPESREYSAYPALLRDPRAHALRAVYDALNEGPKALDVLVASLQKTVWPEAKSGDVMAALMGLRKKNLVHKCDAMVGGDWELV